jgi:hypothetical protein
MKNLFTHHPKQAGETYLEHFLFSFGVGMWLLYCSCSAVCHAIFPFTCTFTTSSNLKKINAIMQKRLEVLNARREENKSE